MLHLQLFTELNVNVNIVTHIMPGYERLEKQKVKNADKHIIVK